MTTPADDFGHPLDRDAAFTQLYRLHRPALVAFALRRMAPSDVDDVVAETFVRAYRSLPAEVWTSDSEARAWLFRVVQNVTISAGRRRATAAREHRAVGRVEIVDGSVVHTDRHDTDVTTNDDIDDAVRALPDRQRTVLELRFLHDFDVSTTAAIMSLSDDGVRSLTHRALRALRFSLEGHG